MAAALWWLLPAAAVVMTALAALAGRGTPDAATRWDGGTLVAEQQASAWLLQLRLEAAPAAHAVALQMGARTRLPRSVMQSAPEDTAWRTEFTAEGWNASLLTLQAATGGERPIAAFLRSLDRQHRIVVLWCAAAGTAELERLHGFLLGLPAEAVVDLKDGCGVLGPAGMQSQRANVAQLLLRVAEARIARPGEAGAPNWRLVALTPGLDGNQPLEAAAHVHHASRPVAGARVSFAREPHLACSTLTNAEGLARCTLQDTHGHAPHDAGSPRLPTTVTFAGLAGPEALFVPTVAVVATPAPTRCLSDVMPAEVTAGWGADCRGFASRTWTLPVGPIR